MHIPMRVVDKGAFMSVMRGGAVNVRILTTGHTGSAEVRAHVTARLDEALGRLRVAPITAWANFSDEDGPKGGAALRCALTIDVPYQPELRAERSETTARVAFDGAFAALERQLARYRERARDERRHPKKYYAARRVNAADTDETS
jgi:ribosome-associated translation inhibitor RaiA